MSSTAARFERLGFFALGVLLACKWLALTACDPSDFERETVRTGEQPTDHDLPSEVPSHAPSADGGARSDDAEIVARDAAELRLPDAARTVTDAGGPARGNDLADRWDAALADPDAALPAALLDAAAERPFDAAIVSDASRLPSQESGPPPARADSACDTRHAGRALCDGFESGPSSPPWLVHSTDGEIARVAQPTLRGIGALQATARASGGRGFVQRALFPSLTSGTIYLRSHIWIPKGVSLSSLVVHGLAEEPLPYGGISIVLDDDGVMIDVHPEAPGLNPTFIASSPPVVVGRERWTCLQLTVDISASAGSVRLDVDGRLAASRSGLRTLPATGFVLASAGIVYTSPEQAPLSIYIDELVADTKPIPCD